MAPRDHQIDAARGTAMILVVAGHNELFSVLALDAVRVIFLFHVAAFFVISGYLLKPAMPRLPRLCRRMLVPFGLAALLFAVVKALARHDSPWNWIAGALWGTGTTLSSSPLWFIPCLFLTLIVTAGLAVWIDRGKPALRFCVVAALLAIASYAALRLPSPSLAFPGLDALRRPGVTGPIGWPWSADLVPVSVLYTLSGHMLGRHGAAVPRSGLAAAACLLIVALAYALGARSDLNLRLMHPFALSLLAGLAGAVCVIFVSGLAIRIGALGRILVLVGQNTMSILIFHLVLQSGIVALFKAERQPAVLALGLVLGVGGGVAGPMLLARVYGLAREQVRARIEAARA